MSNFYHSTHERKVYGHPYFSRAYNKNIVKKNITDPSSYGGSHYLVSRLEKVAELDKHHGCINTVRWNSLGNLIVSGSDDTCLGLWKMYPHKEKHSEFICKFNTLHTRNLFHALFVPNTNDDEIISCALDCDIRYNIISKEASDRIGTHSKPCHKLSLIDKFQFLSCSEDGSIKFMDLRDKSTINSSTFSIRCKNTIALATKILYTPPNYITNPNYDELNDSNNNDIPKQIFMTYPPRFGTTPVCIYSMSINPMNSYIIAAGCRDKWIRLYDRRKLSLGNGKKSEPYCLMTQHLLLHKEDIDDPYDYDTGVTGVEWSYDGRELVGTFSGGEIGLFNLYSPKICSDFKNCRSIIEQNYIKKQNKKKKEEERKKKRKTYTLESLWMRRLLRGHTNSDDDDDDDEDDEETKEEIKEDNEEDNKEEENNNNDPEIKDNDEKMADKNDKNDNNKENSQNSKPNSRKSSVNSNKSSPLKRSRKQSNELTDNDDNISNSTSDNSESDNCSDEEFKPPSKKRRLSSHSSGSSLYDAPKLPDENNSQNNNDNNEANEEEVEMIDNSNQNRKLETLEDKKKEKEENDELNNLLFDDENSNNEKNNEKNKNYIKLDSDDDNQEDEEEEEDNEEDDEMTEREKQTKRGLEILEEKQKIEESNNEKILEKLEKLENNNNNNTAGSDFVDDPLPKITTKFSEHLNINNKKSSIKKYAFNQFSRLKNRVKARNNIWYNKKQNNNNLNKNSKLYKKNNNKLNSLTKRLKNFMFKNKNDLGLHSEFPICLETRKFGGHRTRDTVKEVNFFGQRSEYIISGSDCGNVFIWDKKTGKLVNLVKGDNDITNVVQGNPLCCSLVTAGLDTSLKYFLPTADESNKMSEKDEIFKNNKTYSSRPTIPHWLYVLLRRGLISSDDEEEEEEETKEDNNNNNTIPEVNREDSNDDDDDENIYDDNNNNNDSDSEMLQLDDIQSRLTSISKELDNIIANEKNENNSNNENNKETNNNNNNSDNNSDKNDSGSDNDVEMNN